MSLLSRRERLTQQRIESGALSVFDNTPRAFAKITELLYNTLSVYHMLSDDIIARFQTTGVRQFIFDYERLAEPIIRLADTATGIQKGELNAAWDGCDLDVSTTSRHTATVEWFAQRNLRPEASLRRGESVDPRELFSPEALRAQQTTFGFDAADLFEFCSAGHFSSKGFDSLRFLDPPRLDQRSQYLVRHLILNPRRLRTFYAPFFFDLGSRRRSPLDDFQVVINATARTWSYYYPFIGLGADSESPLHLVSSRGVLAMFFVALHIHKNSLSASLEAACREEGRKEDAAEVSALIKIASLALEKEVCDIAEACGWLAATSESKLPCGDIDALLAIPVGDERVRLVVCEVKDADLLAHRENTFEIHEEFASKVRRQLKNKSEWLVRNWSKGFGVRLFGAEIGSRHTGDLVRVLITRDRVPLTTGEEFILLSVGELRPFIAQLKCELPPWLLAGEPPKATCF